MGSKPHTLACTAATTLLALLITPLVAVAQEAPLAWWPFNDGTAADATGNGNDGQMLGDPAPGDGVVGQGLHFDGTADEVMVPDATGLDAENVSLSLWVRLDGPPSGPAVLAQKLSGGTGYSLRVLAGGEVRLEAWQAGAAVLLTSPYPLTPGIWTSVFASYDGADLELYLQGTLAASSPGIPLNVQNDVPLLMGVGLAGTLDEVKLGPGGASPTAACAHALKIWHQPSHTCLDAVAEIGAALGVDDLTHQTFGAALVDADQDGWLDLYVVNGLMNPAIEPLPSGTCPDLTDPPAFPPENFNVFFRNRGDGTFEPDSAPQIGLDDPWNAMRTVWGDYDNDGDRDVFAHNFLVSNLYKNVTPPGSPMLFENANDESGLHVCETSGTGMSWADIDNDGFLDLYTVEYAPNRTPAEHVNQLFLNNGGGTFREITQQAGVAEPNNPMGIAFADYDNDGDADVFLSNSHEQASRLYRNDGPGAGGVPTFTDVAVEAGVAVSGDPNRGFGGAWGDYDNDGLLDLLFIREHDSRLYRNLGSDGGGTWRFLDVTGLGGLVLSGSQAHDGNFADIDNDGWLDLILAAWDGPNLVFLNNGDRTWREVGATLGMDRPELIQRGVMPGDIDNDGDVDVVLTTFNLGDPNLLFRNDARGNNWVQFRLKGVRTNRDAVGARIEVRAQLQPGGPEVTQIREVVAGTGFFADIPRIQSFGLGHATEILEARVIWPGGLAQDLGAVRVNERHDVLEPTAASGAVPDGADVPGTPLSVARDGGGALTLTWGASCSAADDDYSVYEGRLRDFGSHEGRLCSTGGATSATFLPAAVDSYYLVVPRNSTSEGSYGLDSGGFERPAAAVACAPQSVGACQ